MIQLFFDTAVWFDYCWARQNQKRPKINSFIGVDKINSRKAKVLLSDPLIYEISSLFKERFLIKQAFSEGISAFEVRRIRREISLKGVDRREVDKILERYIYSLSVSKDQWLFDWLDQEVLDKVFRLTSLYDIEFIDCLHIMAALIANCEVFVTKDESLIKAFLKTSKRTSSLRKLKMIKPQEFISSYGRKIFKK